jgi:hypothetical protein
MRRRRATALAVALVVAVVAAACSDDDDGDAAPTPRPTDGPPISAVDYSGVALARVPGETTTTGPPATGSASIVGTVSGPGGLLPGATVRVDRIVEGDDIRTDVAVGPDGRFELRGVPGGRYRVRAFLPPAMSMLSPEIRFLRDGEEHAFDLRLEDQRRVVARASVAPDPPYVDEDLNLAVVVAMRSVDVDGVVRSVPVQGLQVELAGLGAWTLRTQAPARSPLQPRASTTTTTFFRPPSPVTFTDGFGEARWELRCDVPGDPGLSILVSVSVTPPAIEGQPPPAPEQRLEQVDLDVPACVDPFLAPPSDQDGDAELDQG